MSKLTKNEAIKSLIKNKTNPRQLRIYIQKRPEDIPEFYKSIPNDVADVEVIAPDIETAETLINLRNFGHEQQ